MRNILIAILLCLISIPALAGDGITTALTANNTSYAFAVISSKGPQGQPYQGCVNIYGTWNGATVSYKVSTDDGTTKVAMKDLSGVALTSTANDVFCFTWGWPNNTGDQTIFYAATSGAVPTLTLDLFDNR